MPCLLQKASTRRLRKSRGAVCASLLPRDLSSGRVAAACRQAGNPTLQIVGSEASLLRDAAQHLRPNLLVVVEYEDGVSPSLSAQSPVRAGLPLNRHPILRRAARIRRALLVGQLLTQRGRSRRATRPEPRQAVFDINTVESLGGDLPTPQRRLVEAWVEIHREELRKDWDLLQSGQPPVKIEPLR